MSWDDPRSCQIIHLWGRICCASEVGRVGRASGNSSTSIALRPRLIPFFLNYLPYPCLDLASHVPPVATVSHSCTPLCPNSDPSPLAHPYPFIFYPLLLSPMVFHNNTPLPFLPPPPTARQAYLIPQPRCNQPTSLLVPQINNTVRHTHTFSNSPPPWFLSPASLKQLHVPQILALCFLLYHPSDQHPISDITVEVTAVTLWLLQLSLVVT